MTANIDDQKLYEDQKMKERYDIQEKLGEGCFGKLFRSVNRKRHQVIALKIEFCGTAASKRSNLLNEINILDKLKGVQRVPKVYDAGRWTYGYFMELDLLSSSLYSEKGKEFSQSEIYSMVC
jgi:predicted Ser/Thr protein kinase